MCRQNLGQVANSAKENRTSLKSVLRNLDCSSNLWNSYEFSGLGLSGLATITTPVPRLQNQQSQSSSRVAFTMRKMTGNSRSDSIDLVTQL